MIQILSSRHCHCGLSFMLKLFAHLLNNLASPCEHSAWCKPWNTASNLDQPVCSQLPPPMHWSPEPLSWSLSLSIIPRLLKMWFLSHICRNDILFSLVAFWTFGKGYPVVWGSLALAFVTQHNLSMIHRWISIYNKIDLSLSAKKKAPKSKQQKTKPPPKMFL